MTDETTFVLATDSPAPRPLTVRLCAPDFDQLATATESLMAELSKSGVKARNPRLWSDDAGVSLYFETYRPTFH